LSTQPYSYEDIAQAIDHALLTPGQVDADLDQGIAACAAHGVKGVCVQPYYVGRCAGLLAGTATLPCTVIGFPHGGSSIPVKVFECGAAVAAGAVELDAVVNTGKVLSADWGYVQAEIEEMTHACHEHGRGIKIIFENALLTDRQKVRLCGVCAAAGVDFVKTSTGFASGGATAEDCRLMRQATPAHIQVKVSGGLRTLDDLLVFRNLGAARFGTSATFAILADCRARLGAGPS